MYHERDRDRIERELRLQQRLRCWLEPVETDQELLGRLVRLRYEAGHEEFRTLMEEGLAAQ